MNDSQLNEKIAEVSKTIFSYCIARTPNRADAEDLSQDILCELVKSVKNIRDDDAFYGFMWAVAGNVYKQWCRKKEKSNVCELTDDIPSEDKTFEFDDDYTDIYLLRRELTLLSEKYRRATILYYIDGKSCSEISQILSISKSMVKYLLFKSRKILKEGMNMERKLGILSYNPKSLIPMYSGKGPNLFWNFMQSKIRQNIVSACYNDSLTPQQISIETGIPLPYLDDEIKALEEKNILIREGTHYKTNIIIITSECADEIEQTAAAYHEKIADTIGIFLDSKLKEYRKIGFAGADFSENTLRWQLAVILFRMIAGADFGRNDAPVTGWGESAYIWCVEKWNEKHIFNYCGVNSRYNDSIYFFDYCRGNKGKGNHKDFYGNDRYINIICDIVRGKYNQFSEYDLEAIAEMIKKGYVIKNGDGFGVTTPVYTKEQYENTITIVKDFLESDLSVLLKDLSQMTEKILAAHTPKHLQDQVAGIAGMDRFVNAVCIPAAIMIEKGYIDTAWNALEMPATYIVLNQ